MDAPAVDRMSDPQWFRLVLSIAAAAFLAWAGVVWRATEIAGDASSQIAVRLESMQRDITRVDNQLADHLRLQSHPGAAAQISRLEAEVSALQRQMDNLKAAHDRLMERQERKGAP
jgi:phage host-nuclease inhibitor protein Gam